MIRFLDIINEIKDDLDDPENMAKFVRVVAEKESHAKITKDEITITWVTILSSPDLKILRSIFNSLYHDGCFKCKQSINRERNKSSGWRQSFCRDILATKETETVKNISLSTELRNRVSRYYDSN